jgi:hypothetical protein
MSKRLGLRVVAVKDPGGLEREVEFGQSGRPGETPHGPPRGTGDGDLFVPHEIVP